MELKKRVLTGSKSNRHINTKLVAGFCATIGRQFAVWLCILLIVVPVPQAAAQEGYLVMQYEFSLSKKPRFRQLNLAYQDNAGTASTLGEWQAPQDMMRIPLYSRDPGVPGLFNRLDDNDEEGDDKSGGAFGQVLAVMLGVGVIGLYVYAAGKCISEYSIFEETPNECKALSSASF
jgi:hypothetical protein